MVGRVLLSLENIYLSFGGKPLFEDLTLHISEEDKICLVGKNGAGKTTLMRLMMEELELDGGSRFVLPGVSIGYLAQNVDFKPSSTVHQFVLSGLPSMEQTIESSYLADIVMAPLDLNPEARMETLSGGQLRRAALARALVTEPDILLLDEPTNHLDIGGIEWLENYLAMYKGALICVSHDRAFLAAVSHRVFWLDRGTIRISPGGYGQFEGWMEQMLEQEARELHNMQKKLDAELDWTQGGVSGRRKRNQRRLNELHRLREKLRVEKKAQRSRRSSIDIDLLEPVQRSKIMAEFKHVSKCFENDETRLKILEDFDYLITKGDRIGIVGRNGSGKSTFIKLLIGELTPDNGSIFRSKTMDLAYFDQNRVHLDPEKTLWETLCPNGGDYIYLGSGEQAKPRHVCGYLKQFMFDPKTARNRVSTLSGGQKNRLMLAYVLAKPGNLLILDEPTNDLDMDTLDMLQEIIADYQGTLIIVSHDRDFLDRTVTEILAFDGDAEVENYIGGYSDYYRMKEQEQVATIEHGNKKGSSGVSGDSFKQRQKTPRMSGKERHELSKLPARIKTLEKEIAALHEVLSNPDLYVEDPDAFDKATRRAGKAQTELEEAEIRWLELEEKAQKLCG